MKTKVQLTAAIEALPWMSGSASFEDGWLVVDIDDTGGRAIHFGQNLPFAFAGVRSPVEAVAFVEQFGLLQVGLLSEETFGTHRESFADWQREIAALNTLMTIYIEQYRALAGEPESVERLRSLLVSEGLEKHDATADEAMLHASPARAFLLRQGIGGNISVTIESKLDPDWNSSDAPAPVEKQTWVARPKTLLSAIYTELSVLMDDHDPIAMRHCEDESCGRVFLVGYPLQRFCNNTCASRTRYHRRARRQRESAGAVDAGKQSD